MASRADGGHLRRGRSSTRRSRVGARPGAAARELNDRMDHRPERVAHRRLRAHHAGCRVGRTSRLRSAWALHVLAALDSCTTTTSTAEVLTASGCGPPPLTCASSAMRRFMRSAGAARVQGQPLAHPGPRRSPGSSTPWPLLRRRTLPPRCGPGHRLRWRLHPVLLMVAFTPLGDYRPWARRPSSSSWPESCRWPVTCGIPLTTRRAHLPHASACRSTRRRRSAPLCEYWSRPGGPISAPSGYCLREGGRGIATAQARSGRHGAHRACLPFLSGADGVPGRRDGGTFRLLLSVEPRVASQCHRPAHLQARPTTGAAARTRGGGPALMVLGMNEATDITRR